MLLAGHTAPRVAAQATGETSVTVISGTVDDAADPHYPATYNYLVLRPAGGACCGSLTRSPAGSETYQAYSDIDGSILDTEAVSDANGSAGSARLTFPSGIPYHVININDLGNGSEPITGDVTVVVGINLGAGSQPTAEPTATPTTVEVISVVTTDPADPDFPAAYNYFLSSMPRVLQSHDDLVASAPGSETYQAYSDADGSILDTETVGDDGSTTLTVPAGVDYHVININDPGTGTQVIPSGPAPLVTVVLNPGADAQPTAVPTNEPTAAPSSSTGTGGSGTGSTGTGATTLPNTGAGTGAAMTAPLAWLIALALAVLAFVATSLTLRRRTARR